MLRQLLTFRRDHSGAIALLFAFLLPLLLLFVGGAVDVARAISARSDLQIAADSAALAAAKAGAELRTSSDAQNRSDWKQRARKIGETYFVSNLAKFPYLTSSKPKFTLELVDGYVSATVDYAARSKNMILPLADIALFDLAGRSTAMSNRPNYFAINFVIDNSVSMGIGVTAADQQLMMNTIGCTVACHSTDKYGNRSTVEGARASGANLRIDEVKRAILAIVDKLIADQEFADQFEFSVYTFSNFLEQKIVASSDQGAIHAVVDPIDLATGELKGGTNTTYALKQFAELTNTGGDGTSDEDRKTFTILLTDGVQNSTSLTAPDAQGLQDWMSDPNYELFAPSIKPTWEQTVQGFFGGSCGPIKSKNHQVMVIDIAYLVPSVAPDSNQPRYQFIGSTLIPNNTEQYKACASTPSYVFDAATSADLTLATEQIELAVKESRLRLTQ